MVFLSVANTIVEFIGIIGADQLLSCCYNFKLFSKIMGIIIWLIQKRER